jgi:putative DNA primase/helicase
MPWLHPDSLQPLTKVDILKTPFNQVIHEMLDPKTRELVRALWGVALTWSLYFNYLPKAQCSTIQSWLDQMVGDEGTVQLLKALMAATLRGPAKYQKFLHFIGPGGTGKSTFIRLEKNTISTNLKQLEQNRFEAATLYGKRLALITDSDKYGGSINVLKALTGQDPIRLERKHIQQSGSFIFGGLVVMASIEEALILPSLEAQLNRPNKSGTLAKWFSTLPEEIQARVLKYIN